MAWNWRFWRRSVTAKREMRSRTEGSLAEGEEGPLRIEDWQARLIEAGVSEQWAAPLASRLAPNHRELGQGSALALVRGAALAVEMQAQSLADVELELRDMREVERLLGAFSGELEKLDEVLEVLSTFAQRMRAKPIARSRRVLH